MHLAFFDDGEMSTQDGRQTCEDAAAPFWVRGAGADAPAYAGETYLASMMGATQRVSSMSLEDMEMEMLAADLAVEMKATADARASEREAARLEDEMMAPPCEDDAAFRLNGVEFRDCGWVAKKPAKRCEDARARAACPLTCGACGGASIGRRLQASETIFVAWFVPSGDGPLPDVYAAAGDAVFIAVPPGHSVWRMASQAAWTACDFTGAVEVAAVADAARDAAVDVATGETGYFACDQGAHCANGMKARVVVASIADECAASFDFGALEPTPWPGGVANQNQDDARADRAAFSRETGSSRLRSARGGRRRADAAPFREGGGRRLDEGRGIAGTRSATTAAPWRSRATPGSCSTSRSRTSWTPSRAWTFASRSATSARSTPSPRACRSTPR